MARSAYARACVEIDLDQPLCPGVRIGPPNDHYWQESLYENVGLSCYRCGKICHRVPDCELPANGGFKRKVASITDGGTCSAAGRIS